MLQNAMVIGAAAAYEATLGADVNSLHTQLARERILADLDGLTDWLGAACVGRSNVSSERALRMPHRLDEADVPTILHAAIACAEKDDAADCLRAVKLLIERYMLAESRRALELAQDIANGC